MASWRRKLWAVSRLARAVKPAIVLSFGGGLGDQLLLTTLAREFRVRGEKRVWVSTYAPELFAGNRDVQRAVHQDSPRDKWFIARFGGRSLRSSYAEYDAREKRDVPPEKHMLALMCRQAGISGQVSLRPYLNLTRGEVRRGKLFDRQVAIQSTGRASKHFMLTKEWYPERFQTVVTSLKHELNFVQIGSANDVRIEGAHDLRGKLSLRETSAVLASSMLFVGLVGFLMHVARAVDCRAVIVYGGRELPSQSGYVCNENITGKTACSPCWRRDDCAGQRACMDMITAEQVVQAVQKSIGRDGQPLEVEQLTV